MTDIGMPERIGRRGLPPPPERLAYLGRANPIEPVLDEEPPHRGLADLSPVEAAIGLESTEDQGGADTRSLTSDVEQQLTLLDGELLPVAPVAPALRVKRGEAPATVGVVPALQGRHRVGPGDVAPGRAHALVGERSQQLRELAALERTAAQERPQQLRSEEGDGLAVVFGSHLIGHVFAPFVRKEGIAEVPGPTRRRGLVGRG